MPLPPVQPPPDPQIGEIRPPVDEPFLFSGRSKDVVEHEATEESVVETPNVEQTKTDLISASVLEVKEESIIEEKEEVVVQEKEQKGIWKPPDAED